MIEKTLSYEIDRQKTWCRITKLSGIGERRTYRGLLQPFAAHIHEYFVVGLVKQGERKLVCNGYECLLRAGDMIVFNPGDSHGCTHTSEELFAYDSLAIDPAVLGPSRLQGPKVINDKAAETFQRILVMTEELGLSDEESNVIYERLSRGREIAVHASGDRDDTAPSGGEWEACCSTVVGDSLLEAVIELGSQLAREAVTSAQSHVHEQAALQVYTYFCDHISQPISLRALAAMVHLSPYALIRAYTAYFGLTPMQHLLSLRVEQAMTLLSQGITPSIVAQQCGFADQAHLTREFKKRMGVTPGAYRRMVCEKAGVGKVQQGSKSA